MNKTAKNSVVYLAGTVVIGILGFVNTMVLTRVLSTRVYAMYGLLISVATTIMMFLSFGFDSAYMRFYYNNGHTKKKFLWMSLKPSLILFCVFALAILEPTHTLLKYIFETDISFWVALIFIAYIFFATVHRFTQLTARMEEFAGNYIASNIAAKSGFIIFILAFFLIFKMADLGDIPFYLVLLSFATSSVLSVIINVFIFSKASKSCEVISDQKALAITHKDLFKYGFPYMINNVIVLVIPTIEKIIIRDQGSWDLLGIFTAAAVFQTVVSLLQHTLNNIWQPIAFKNCDDKEKFSNILHNFGLLSTVLVALAFVVFLFLRRWLVLFLDSNYYSVYIIMPTIMLGSCFNIITLIYSIGIDIQKKTYHLVIAPIIQGVLSIVLCFWLIPEMGLIGVAIATLVSQVAAKTYRIIVGVALYGTGRVEWKPVVVIGLCCVVAITSLFFTGFVFDAIFTCLILAVLVLTVNKEAMALFKYFKNILKPQKRLSNDKK